MSPARTLNSDAAFFKVSAQGFTLAASTGSAIAPLMKGVSPRNLKYMRAFAEAYPDQAIVQEVFAQIPWCHNQALLDDLLRHPDDQPTIGIVL